MNPPGDIADAHDELVSAFSEIGRIYSKAADSASHANTAADVQTLMKSVGSDVSDAQGRADESTCALQDVADQNGIDVDLGCGNYAAEPDSVSQPTPRPTARQTQQANRTASATPKATPSVAEIGLIWRDTAFQPYGSTYGVGASQLTDQGVNLDVRAGEPIRIVLTNLDQFNDSTVTVYEDAEFTIPVPGANTGPVSPEEEGEFTVTFERAKTYYFRNEMTYQGEPVTFRNPAVVFHLSGTITAK